MHIEVWFDGSCWPKNPGGRGGFGWIAYEHAPVKTKIAENYGFIGEGPSMSNNVAEYAAVLDAMIWIELNRPASRVIFHGDSALVINQLSGRWRIKRGLYADTAIRAKAKLRPQWTFRWIPREKNEEADALSVMGSAPPRMDVEFADRIAREA